MSKRMKLLGLLVVIPLLVVAIISCAGPRLILQITSPYAAAVTESSTAVSGTVSDPSAIVTVNDIEVEVAEDGAFSTSVELDYGRNSIVVTAIVEAVEPVSKTLWITLD